jgi:hypothetical protein
MIELPDELLLVILLYNKFIFGIDIFTIIEFRCVQLKHKMVR